MKKKEFILAIVWIFFFLLSGTYSYADYYYNYYTYDEMVDLLTDLESQAVMQTPNVFSLQNIGESYEGNPIYAVKFSDNPEIEEESEPVIVIDAGIHGNEIIAEESCINYIQYLFDAYYNPSHPNHAEVVAMINDLQIWIIPMINPDGRIKDTDGGDGDPAVYYTDANFLNGWRVNTQPFPCPAAPDGFIRGANLNRTFSINFNYDDDCSERGGYDYGGSAPFALEESRVLKKFILNHMVSFVFHQHSPLQAFLTYAGPFGIYVSNEIVRIYNEDLINPIFALVNAYDPSRDLEPPPTDPLIQLFTGQYPPWLWSEITDRAAPDYLSRRGIPAIIFEYPVYPSDNYGVVADGKFGQYDRNDGTNLFHMSSGEAVEWLLDKSIEIYNFLVKQTRYFYSPRYYTDMSRKPGGILEDLALVGAKISEVGSGLPGCIFYRESDGRDLLERGSKRVTWNVQNNGIDTRTINSEISICNLTDDPNCLTPVTDRITRSGVAPEELEIFTYDYDFLDCADYAVTLITGEGVNYDNDLKRFTFTVVATGDSDCDGPIEGENCPIVLIFGENSDEAKLLRSIRDNILSKKHEGRELIKLYYQWSPFIVRAMEADEKFKQEVKGIVGEVLSMIQVDME